MKKAKKGKKESVAGQPEATEPLPGQNDPSKPQVVIPPAIQDLLDKLPKLPINTPTLDGITGSGGLGSITGPHDGQVDDRSADKLLDFLMAP
jgi:hypothetical protein